MARSSRFLLLTALLVSIAATTAALWWMGEEERDLAPRALEGRVTEVEAATLDALAQAESEGLEALTEAARRAPPARMLKLSGRVIGPKKLPVNAARVEVELETGNERAHAGRVPLARAFTDWKGQYELELPGARELLKLGGPDATLRVTVLALRGRPGLREGIELNARRDTLRLDFKLHSGGVAFGRVMTRAGEAVAGAELLLLERGEPGEEHTWRQRGTARSFVDGRFGLPIVHAGTYSILARAEGIGAARIDGVSIGRRGTDLGRITLQGAGELVGAARYPDGSACEDLVLIVVPAELTADPDAVRRVGELLHEREGTSGLISARIRTDADGAFHAAGLQPGAYELRPLENDIQLTAPGAVHWTGRAGILIELRSRRLDLELIEPDGGAPGLVEVRCVAPDPRLSDDDAPPLASIERRTDPRGRARFELPEAARSVGLSVRRGREQLAELRLELPADLWRIARRIELPLDLPPGRIHLRVRGAAEEVLPAYLVELHSTASLSRSNSYKLLPRADELSPPLLPGDYRVLLEPGGRARRQSDLLAIRPSQAVTVTAGETTLVELQPVHGGRLQLELTPPAGWVTDTLGVNPGWRPKRIKKTLAGKGRGDANAGGHGAVATLLAADGEEIRLEFEARGRLGTGQRSSLVPGLERGTSQALAPGAYQLRVETPGFQTCVRPLVLHAGVVAPVELELTPE